MISRITTMAALLACAAAWAVPVQAQTGVTAQGAVNSGVASPTGSVGTTSNTPRTISSSTSATMAPKAGGIINSPGTTDMPAQANAKAGSGVKQMAQAGPRSGRARGDMAERQMTECLNNAAAQQKSFDSCRR
jgi:hypothetical protein